MLCPSINVNLASLCPRIAALGRCLSLWVCFPCVSVTLPTPCHPIPVPRPWTKGVTWKVPKHDSDTSVGVQGVPSVPGGPVGGHRVKVRHRWAVRGSVWDSSSSSSQGSRQDRGSQERGRGQSVLDLAKSRTQPQARESKWKSKLEGGRRLGAARSREVAVGSLDPKIHHHAALWPTQGNFYLLWMYLENVAIAIWEFDD